MRSVSLPDSESTVLFCALFPPGWEAPVRSGCLFAQGSRVGRFAVFCWQQIRVNHKNYRINFADYRCYPVGVGPDSAGSDYYCDYSGSDRVCSYIRGVACRSAAKKKSCGLKALICRRSSLKFKHRRQAC